MDDIAETICSIIAKEARLDPATVRPDSSVEDLKIASIDLIQIIFAIEEKFDIDIPEEAIKMDVKNVSEVVEAVKKLIADKAGGAAPQQAT